MLEAGEIDALYSAIVPPSLIKGSTRVRRLFEELRSGSAGLLPPNKHLPDHAHRRDQARRLPRESLGRQGDLRRVQRGANNVPPIDTRMGGAFMHGLFMVPWLTAHLEVKPTSDGRRPLAVRPGAQPEGAGHLPAVPSRARLFQPAVYARRAVRSRDARRLEQLAEILRSERATVWRALLAAPAAVRPQSSDRSIALEHAVGCGSPDYRPDLAEVWRPRRLCKQALAHWASAVTHLPRDRHRELYRSVRTVACPRAPTGRGWR